MGRQSFFNSHLQMQKNEENVATLNKKEQSYDYSLQPATANP